MTIVNLLQVEGKRYANGVELNPDILTAVSAYVQQDDQFIGTLTSREHLIFQAKVRMDTHIPYQQRLQRVDEVISQVCQCLLIVQYILSQSHPMPSSARIG